MGNGHWILPFRARMSVVWQVIHLMLRSSSLARKERGYYDRMTLEVPGVLLAWEIKS
jgi:hypothetical protein